MPPTRKRVGTDALSPTFAQLLPMAFPNAELVDGEPAMRTARRIKTAEEIAALRGALTVAEDGLAAAVAELAPGITEQTAHRRDARGDGSRWGEHVGHPGRRVDHPAGPPWRWAGVTAGSPTVIWWRFASGALADGYVGEVGRTWPVGDVPGADALYGRSNDLWDRLVAACRPGAPASDLFAAYEAAGEALPPMPVAHGLGLGFDPPVISPDLARTSAAERLDPGMVLAVTGYVWEAGVGAVFRRDAVLITDDRGRSAHGQPRRRRKPLPESAEGEHMSDSEAPLGRGDHPLREGPEDQDRDDHVQPSRVS